MLRVRNAAFQSNTQIAADFPFNSSLHWLKNKTAVSVYSAKPFHGLSVYCSQRRLKTLQTERGSRPGNDGGPYGKGATIL